MPHLASRLDSRPLIWVCAAVAVALAVVGVVLLTVDRGVTTRAVNAGGVPMLVVTGSSPADAGVVVAHGFAGSARLMRGFADTLARRGYVVAIPDLSGHGANPRALRLDGFSVAHDLDVAVKYLRTGFGLPEDRIALVGHSMGAGAVTRYAVEHPAVPVTVAISLGSAEDLPDGVARPRNLLLIVGGLEFRGFRDAADEALRRGGRAGGDTRRVVTVPGREHISVLFADQTHREAALWLDRALGRPSTSVDVHARDRLLPAGLLLLAGFLGFIPVPVLFMRPVRTIPTARPPGWARVAVAVAGGAAAAILGAEFLPTVDLPLAVGGYTAGFLAVIGLALIAVSVPWRTTGLRAPSLERRVALAAPVLVAYGAAAVAVPVHLGFTHAVPVGARWWLLPVTALAVFVLLLGVELAAAGRWAVRAGLLMVTVTALGVAAVAGTGPGFVLLVLPLLALLLVWHLGWAAVLGRRGAPPWLRAAVGAGLVAWPIATTLPLVVSA